jgi:hypothetical protein
MLSIKLESASVRSNNDYLEHSRIQTDTDMGLTLFELSQRHYFLVQSHCYCASADLSQYLPQLKLLNCYCSTALAATCCGEKVAGVKITRQSSELC